MSLALCSFKIKLQNALKLNNKMFRYMFNDGTNKLVASFLNGTSF